MPILQVNKTDYEVVASILKIGKNARHEISWGEFVDLMLNLGYKYYFGGHKGKGRTSSSHCRFERGTEILVLKYNMRPSTKLELFNQDYLKKMLEGVLGWSKTSFATA